MTQNELVRVTVQDAGIATIHMSDRAGKNALTRPFIAALLEALESVERDPSIKVAMLRGTDEYFCTGANREILTELSVLRTAPPELRLGLALLDLRIPIIAVAEGSAIGGGFALLLSADIIMIARESRYGANFMALGITPGMGMTRLLETTFSTAVAHELLYTGDLRKGSSFEGNSAFNAILPRSALLARAHEVAWSIAGHDAENLRLLKQTLTSPRRRVLEEAMTLESQMHEASLSRFNASALP